MTANQRRPGFRLPWSAEGAMDDAGSGDEQGHAAQAFTDPSTAATPAKPSAGADAGHGTADLSVAADASADAAAGSGSSDEMGDHAAAASATAADDEAAVSDEASGPPADARPADPSAAPAAMEAQTPTEASAPAAQASGGDTPQPASSGGFLGELLTAMRRVADETRDASLGELRQRADQAIRDNEADAERRRGELRTQAEADVAGVGEWAKAEAERIKAEAEQRVAARRARMDEQINAETSRVEASSAALRARVAGYERELEAYHAQLAAIGDPAAFAAAATRMPPPPALDGSAAAPPQPEPVAEPEPEAAPEPEAKADAAAPSETHASVTNGSSPAAPVADAGGQDVPATQLEPLDSSAATAAASEPETLAEPVATEIVVKGLGSFGAITGFRQQLAAVDGIDAVGLSLGTSGEFVFRATHRPSLDMSAAITTLEGDAVQIEPRPEGGLRVTLGRPR